MNRLIYYILKKKKEKEYMKYIENHKNNIERAFEEMVMCPDMHWIRLGILSCGFIWTNSKTW